MMSARGTKRRGRPPKSVVMERPRKFQYHLMKKPKYLLNRESKGSETPNSQTSTPTPSRASSPVESISSRRSARTRGKYKKRGTGGYQRRGYNPDVVEEKESEYHYGSDFGDESSGKSDFEDDILQSDSELDSIGGASSDSEFSLSSYSTVSGSPKKFLHRPPSPEPLWLQNCELPPLDLPKSSEDLLIPREHVMQALCIYEVLRHFRTLVRLSPFRFEDFCSALICEEQSMLLAEIHIMLLKALLREEDSQQTHFGPLDQKDSVNVVLYFVDAMTWPEVLRSYVESDKDFDTEVLHILSSCEYPFTDTDNRLKVLQFMTDQFLITNPVREDLLNEGWYTCSRIIAVCKLEKWHTDTSNRTQAQHVYVLPLSYKRCVPSSKSSSTQGFKTKCVTDMRIHPVASLVLTDSSQLTSDTQHLGNIHYDDHCRMCHRLGDLLCCETCPAVFHLECVEPPMVDVPQDDWQCSVCKAHKVTGVVDCVPEVEKSGMLCRQEHLGFDRHGRKYWFLCRRIFVSEGCLCDVPRESEEGEVWYYSTPTQLYELLECLDQSHMEVALAREIFDFKEEIVRQMELTEKITNQNKGNKKSYLDIENASLVKLQREREERRLKEEEERREKEHQEAEELVRRMHEEGVGTSQEMHESSATTTGTSTAVETKDEETEQLSLTEVTSSTTVTTVVTTTTTTTTSSTSSSGWKKDRIPKRMMESKYVEKTHKGDQGIDESSR
uniref:Uncharacterized protein n=1 Tax=Timema monikensis TaxID=170555 RepID=A0A7R9HST2_9NEOP|nr:unnamed protein product [Timema monikensis]